MARSRSSPIFSRREETGAAETDEIHFGRSRTTFREETLMDVICSSAPSVESGNDKVSGQVKEDSKTRRRRKTGAYHEGARPTTAKSIIQRDENGDLSDSASSRPANPLTCPPQQQLSLTWSFDSRRIICGGWGGGAAAVSTH